MYTCRPIYHMLLLLAVAGCPAPPPEEVEVEDTDPTGNDPLKVVCTDPAAVTCEDAIISDLSLHDDKISEGAVTNEVDGADFVTSVDATAGGFDVATQNPWVYIKFTEEGAVKVEIDDETALESMDWDLAARRFILRLNGGVSGPSCVGAVPFLEQTYEELTEIPEGLTYTLDDFYTNDCTIINDSSGLPDSPQVALSPWWSYSACVATTKIPFLIQLADGHIVKFRVDQYYGEGQVDCNQSDVAGTDSANFQFRWTFLK
jgi:hypothetical protein